jgi:Icc-related predicted phosphoesterase
MPGPSTPTVVRIAAVGDVHVGLDTAPVLGPPDLIAESADLLLVAGDLTRRGMPAEAEVLAAELRAVPVPVIAVLGNHDFESDAADDVRGIVEDAGATVLDGESVTIDVGDVRVGVAGTPGFGGGFPGASCSEFGEPLMKAFVAHTRAMASSLCRSLQDLDADVRVAVTHYSPIEATLVGERLEIYPFLGSYLLAEAIDTGGAHLAVHGHAHRGSRAGETLCGVPVRNVAQPVLGRPYTVLRLSTAGLAEEHAPVG